MLTLRKNLFISFFLLMLLTVTSTYSLADNDEFDPFDLSGFLETPEIDSVLYDLIVNGSDQSEGGNFFYFIIDRENDIVHIEEKGYRYFRLIEPPNNELWRTFDGDSRQYYPLNEIPELSYVIDDDNLTVSVEFPRSMHRSQNFAFISNQRPVYPELSSKALSARLNYDISFANTAGESTNGGAIANTLFAWPLYTLEHSHAYSTNLDQESFSRLRTTLTRDFLDYGAQLSIGDLSTISNSGGNIFRGGRLYGGIAWYSPDNPDPIYRNFPTTAIEGVAVQPSVIEIYQGNLQRIGIEVEPGPFTVDVPASFSSNGDANFIVRDILGREQLVEIPFFYNGNLVRKGSYSYSYELGKNRQNFGIEDFDYGDWFAASAHRYGLTDQLTVAAETEVASDYSAIGVRANYGFYPLKSAFGLSGSRSHSRARGYGSKTNFSFQTQLFRPISFNFLASYTERNFQAFPGSGNVSNKWNIRLGIGRYNPYLKGQLSLIYTAIQNYDVEDYQQRLSFSQSTRLGKTRIRITGSMDPESPEGYTLNLALSRTFGQHNGSVSSNIRPTPIRSTYRLGRSATNNRIGHQVSYSTDYEERHSFSAGLAARTELGNGSLSVFSNPQAGGNASALSLSFNGALAYVDKHFLATRTIGSSFAFVDTDGAANVLVKSQSTSRYTNPNGYAVVSGLSPYALNYISLSDEARLDVFDRDNSATVVPTRGGGILVQLETIIGGGATAILVDQSGTALPVGTTITHPYSAETMYIADKGFTFLVDLQNTTTLTANLSGKMSWICEIVYPDTKDPLPDIGTITCNKAANYADE